MPERPSDHQAGSAPRPLLLIEELVNTRRAGGDDLATPHALAAWLRARQLLPAGAPVTETDRGRAVRVREGLRALIAANNAPPVTSPRPDGLDPAARTELADLAHDLPLTLDVAGDPPRLRPRGTGTVDAALASLLAIVAEAVADRTWSRLKACREPSCRWAYYDNSRNRSRSWCSMNLCGNRVKARTFHHRTAR